MKLSLLALCILLFSTQIFAASFPHNSAIFTTITEGPMIKHESKTYIAFSKNIKDSITAEWNQQETMGRMNKELNLTKNGILYHVDLNSKQCTQTNISKLTDSINDPDKLAEQMKQAMNLQENGNCESEGLKGTKYSHSFGEVCLYKDVFLLWQSAMGTTTKVTDISFDVALPKSKISLPTGIKCTEGPDLSGGINGMMANPFNKPQGQKSNKANQASQMPSREEMDKAMKQASEMMKQLGGMFQQQQEQTQ